MPREPAPFDNLSEDEFRRRILVPLLSAMGFQDVEHYHDSHELGKDVIGWKEDDDGSRDYVAVVAKVGNINASASGDAQTVTAQVRQAFGAPFSDKTTGDARFVHRVIVATTGVVKERSREAILVQIDPQLRRHVRFWDGRKVSSLIAKFLPELNVPAALEEVRKRLSGLQHFTVTAEVSPDGVVHRVEPKEGGVTILTGMFRFTDTPEGLAAQEEVARFFEEGGSVTVPGEFIDSIEHHEELARLFGNEKPTLIQLGPLAPSEARPVRLEVATSQGPLSYEGLALRLVKSGTRRAEFQTDEGDEPVRLSLVLEKEPPERKRIAFNLSIRVAAQRARRARSALRVWGAIAAGAPFSVIDVESGRALLPEQSVGVEPPPEDLVQYLDDLAFIEDRLGWDLTLSDDVGDRDLLDARELRQILECGSFSEPFDTYTATLRPKGEINLLAFFPPGETRWVRTTTEEAAYNLLDRTLTLGPSHTVFKVTIPPEEHERLAAQLTAGKKELRIAFHAASDSEGMRRYYRDYLPAEQRRKYDEFRDRFPPDEKDAPDHA